MDHALALISRKRHERAKRLLQIVTAEAQLAEAISDAVQAENSINHLTSSNQPANTDSLTAVEQSAEPQAISALAE